jgi:hypothetical protein
VAYLPYRPAAVVRAVLINIINNLSPKHERQRQQTRRPCDHHSQHEPLISFHCSACKSSRLSCINWTKSDAVPSVPPPEDETAGPRQFRCGSHLCELNSGTEAAAGSPRCWLRSLLAGWPSADRALRNFIKCSSPRPARPYPGLLGNRDRGDQRKRPTHFPECTQNRTETQRKSKTTPLSFASKPPHGRTRLIEWSALAEVGWLFRGRPDITWPTQ